MRKGAGLTLLEIVFASFIFSALLTMLSGIWVMQARAQRQSGQLLVAADLADLEMNHALAQAYHDIEPSSASFTQDWEIRDQRVVYVFTSQVEVFPLVKDGSQVGMKLVRVKVSYPDGSAGTGRKTYSVDSVLTDES